MMDFALPEDHAPMLIMAEEFGAAMPMPSAPAPRRFLALPVIKGEAGKSRRSPNWRLRAPSAHHFLEGSTEVMRLITARCQIGGN